MTKTCRRSIMKGLSVTSRRRRIVVLSMALISMLFFGCAVFDWAIGGVGALNSTDFIVHSSTGLANLEKDRESLLRIVTGVAEAHGFSNRTETQKGTPEIIAYFETASPWACFLSVRETNEQLSANLLQYYQERNKTRLFKRVERALKEDLQKEFDVRLEVQPKERDLQYPWQSD